MPPVLPCKAGLRLSGKNTESSVSFSFAVCLVSVSCKASGAGMSSENREGVLKIFHQFVFSMTSNLRLVRWQCSFRCAVTRERIEGKT